MVDRKTTVDPIPRVDACPWWTPYPWWSVTPHRVLTLPLTQVYIEPYTLDSTKKYVGSNKKYPAFSSRRTSDESRGAPVVERLGGECHSSSRLNSMMINFLHCFLLLSRTPGLPNISSSTTLDHLPQTFWQRIRLTGGSRAKI